MKPPTSKHSSLSMGRTYACKLVGKVQTLMLSPRVYTNNCCHLASSLPRSTSKTYTRQMRMVTRTCKRGLTLNRSTIKRNHKSKRYGFMHCADIDRDRRDYLFASGPWLPAQTRVPLGRVTVHAFAGATSQSRPGASHRLTAPAQLTYTNSLW